MRCVQRVTWHDVNKVDAIIREVKPYAKLQEIIKYAIRRNGNKQKMLI